MLCICSDINTLISYSTLKKLFLKLFLNRFPYLLRLTTVVFIAKAHSSNKIGIWMKLKCRRTMQNVCMVTMCEVWTVETKNGLVYRPHPQFLAQNLSKKVQLYTQVLQFVFQLQSLVFDPLIIKENFIL